MDITPVNPAGKPVINRYGNGGFVINEIAHAGNILITPQEVLPWEADKIEHVTYASLHSILDEEHMPEIILIGTGKQSKPIPDELRDELRRNLVMIEVMDTGAACRTYGILMQEARRVVAALFAV